MQRVLWCAVAVLLISSPAQAQLGGGKKGDARVKTVLEKLGIEYKIDEDGDFKLELPTTGSRTQIVYAISHTEEYGSLEIREIYAYSFKTGGRLSNDLSIDLLRDNDRKKLGAWRIVGSDDKQVAAHAVQISADADADSFKAALDIVKTVADEREKAETGKDDM
jgi:hypothetical protein